MGRLQEAFEERTGMTVTSSEHLDLLEAVATDYRSLAREQEMLGWTILDYVNGNPQELSAQSRREWAQKSRTVWLQDPQAGAAVDLMNDFVFSRGVPKPRAKDPEVQEVIDEAWDDPDNQLILTSYAAQVGLGTDLSLQSNVFFLMFEGEDGKVKLGLLNHDEVENAVRDPDFRQRVLYYVARHRRQEWDFTMDAPKIDATETLNRTVRYYEHWRNVEQAQEEGDKIDKPPADKLGDGKVYHVAINKTSEQIFGNPTMRRLLRWFSAYNDFMAARVDMAQATAAFIMKRKVKGTPNQVARMASRAISRTSELAGLTGTDDNGPQVPPHPGAIITENENVSHEQLKIDSNAGNASADAQMIRANISAAIRFPQSYLGDATNSNLATATSLELPVLKAVEARQEVFEGVYRWFIDRVIERAVDAGRLTKELPQDDSASDDSEAPEAEMATPFDNPADTGMYGPGAAASLSLQQSYEDQNVDEGTTERDLSYEFSMPSPLRRMMTDLSTVVTAIAQTFDPNGTNIELSRILLTVMLGEGLEMADPADVVKKVFPSGYQDPAFAAAMAGGAPGGPPGAAPPAPGPDGQVHADPNNPYGAQGMASDYQANGGSMQQAVVTRARDGAPLLWPQTSTDIGPLVQRLHALEEHLRQVEERRFADLSDIETAKPKGDISEIEQIYSEEVAAVATEVLGRQLHARVEAAGNGKPSG